MLFHILHICGRQFPRWAATAFVALALVFAFLSTASAQTELSAGCDADVTWEIGDADTVATVNILLISTSGDTLYTLVSATANDGVEMISVPCIEADTLVARLQVFAILETPFAFLDESVVIVSAGPTIDASVVGASVDENCEATVTFSATITDDCAPDTADVAVTLIGDNATMGEPVYEITETDSSLEVNGSVVVSGLTGSPALVMVEFMAADNCGRVSSAVDTAEVVDDTPPVVTCPADVVIECSATGGTPADDPQLAEFFAGFAAEDNCDPDPVLSNDAPELFELGVTEVTFTAVDASGNMAGCMAVVEVVDTTPPDIDIELNRSALWPPNHKFHDIMAYVSVSDICDPAPTFVLATIESDEDVNGKGDGNTNPDIHGADIGDADVDFQLRAERSGKGDGRLYTIIYTASDMSGNTASDTATVVVPHDQRGKARASNGYNKIGTGFDAAAERIALIIPSEEGFDPMSIHLRGAQIGNIKGVVSPEMIYRGDVNGDNTDDVVLVYPASTTKDLHLQAQGQRAKTSLHYADQGNNHFVVYDVFDLGAPLTVNLDELELVTFEDDAADDGAGDDGAGDDTGDDTGDDSGDDGSGGDDATDTTGDTSRDFHAQLSLRPNPFNPTATVHYAMPTAGEVTVRVYDINGRLVQTLVSTSQPAGEYSVTWNGLNSNGQSVASGIYFLRLEAPGVGITRKAVMLK